MPKLTKTVVEAAVPRAKQFTVWCSDLPGFGVYVLPSGARSYFVDYRNADGVRRRLTIGRHGKVTTDAARKLALSSLGGVVKGHDPAEERATRRNSLTVKELCDRYMAAASKGLILGKRGLPKKASTLEIDRGRIARHIIPLLGSKLVRDLGPADVHRFIRDVSAGKTALTERTERGISIVAGGAGTATRTTGFLGGILSYAVSEGIITTNPATGVKRPAYKQRSRRMAADDYARLGQALRDLVDECAERDQAIAAARLLALTGCRLGEIMGLRWSEVDEAGGCFRLEDSKEGATVRPIGKPTFAVLATLPRRKGTPHVLPAVRSDGPFGGMWMAWKRIAARAKLDDVTPHTLRHGFASVANDLGFTESTVSALLGHSAGTVTGRYIHHLDAVLVAAADRVAGEVARMMGAE